MLALEPACHQGVAPLDLCPDFDVLHLEQVALALAHAAHPPTPLLTTRTPTVKLGSSSRVTVARWAETDVTLPMSPPAETTGCPTATPRAGRRNLSRSTARNWRCRDP